MSGNDVAVLLAVMATATALAGFAGIVTSIDRRTVGASSSVISFRINLLVVGAIIGILLSLLPIVLEAFEVPTARLWRISSAVAAVGLAVGMTRVVIARVRMSHGLDHGLSRGFFAWNVIIQVAAVIVLTMGAFDVVPARGAYLLNAFVHLHSMSLNFYRIMHMVDESARAIPADARGGG